MISASSECVLHTLFQFSIEGRRRVGNDCQLEAMLTVPRLSDCLLRQHRPLGELVSLGRCVYDWVHKHAPCVD